MAKILIVVHLEEQNKLLDERHYDDYTKKIYFLIPLFKETV